MEWGVVFGVGVDCVGDGLQVAVASGDALVRGGVGGEVEVGAGQRGGCYEDAVMEAEAGFEGLGATRGDFLGGKGENYQV